MWKFCLIFFISTFVYFKSSAQFLGGSGQGISSINGFAFPLLSSNSMYSGGNNDGTSFTLAISKSLSAVNSGYSGGIDDGSNNLLAINISLNASSPFSGGQDDGASIATVNAQMLSATSMFTGGENDGFNSKSSVALILNASTNFAGGADDGSSVFLISGLNLFMNSMFNGGINDGIGNITANALNIGAIGMYAGGEDDGIGFTSVTGIPIVVLSLTWKEFKVAQNGTNALLQWKVGNERNNVGFDIERSFDGIHFSKIGFVKAEISNQIEHQYNYIDTDPTHFCPSANCNEVFYRLRQFDINQKFSFSPIRNMQLSSSPVLFNIYPNPTSNLLSIWINAFRNADLSYDLQLYDNNGILIIHHKQIKTNLYDLDVQKLSSGIYYLKLSFESHIYSYPIIIKH